MAHILKKEHTRLRVKENVLPVEEHTILGNGIDVMSLPEGHLACPICHGFKFECWVMLDNHRLECGCMQCGWSCRFLFPLDVDLSKFGKSGRFTCLRLDNMGHFHHQDKGMIIIHNSGTMSVGCELCRTEVRIRLKTKSNLVLAQ